MPAAHLMAPGHSIGPTIPCGPRPFPATATVRFGSVRFGSVIRSLEKRLAWIITKYFLTAAVVVLVSEIAKRSDKLGGFVAALPLVTVLALVRLYVENQPQDKIANHAWYTFWYVVPTLPMFLAFPVLLPRIGFWPSLLACVIIIVVCFGLFALAVRRFGVELFQ
jgi:hypothetical protein